MYDYLYGFILNDYLPIYIWYVFINLYIFSLLALSKLVIVSYNGLDAVYKIFAAVYIFCIHWNRYLFHIIHLLHANNMMWFASFVRYHQEI